MAVNDQDWLDTISSLYSADLLADGPRIRGMVSLAEAHWVVVGGWGVYHGVREVHAQEVVPRATYTGPTWRRCKYRKEYGEPHDFYVGRLVTWKKQEWVLVRHFLRLVRVEVPAAARPIRRRTKRGSKAAFGQLTLLDKGGDAGPGPSQGS
jgi:hypothetical protein